MNEDRKRIWDIRLGVVTPIIAIASLWVGFFQFEQSETDHIRLQHELAERTSRLEFRRTLWLAKVKAYQTVTELAGAISADPEHALQPHAAADQFMVSYWGVMYLNEGPEVEHQMILLADEIRHIRGGEGDKTRLRLKALKVISVMRAELDSTWRVLEKEESFGQK